MLWVGTGCSRTGWLHDGPDHSWSAGLHSRRRQSLELPRKTSGPSRRTRCGTGQSPLEAWAATRTHRMASHIGPHRLTQVRTKKRKHLSTQRSATKRFSDETFLSRSIYTPCPNWWNLVCDVWSFLLGNISVWEAKTHLQCDSAGTSLSHSLTHPS